MTSQNTPKKPQYNSHFSQEQQAYILHNSTILSETDQKERKQFILLTDGIWEYAEVMTLFFLLDSSLNIFVIQL